MKKILLIVMAFLMIPMSVLGKTYEFENLGVEISFDEHIWDVFAKGKPFDDDLLKKYDWDNETMQSYLNHYDFYIAAVYDGEELFDFSATSKKIDYEVTDYQEFGSSVAKYMGVDNYEIYKNNYNFIKLEYYDSSVSQYIIHYHIPINSQYHLFIVRKDNEFSFDEKKTVEEVIDSIVFYEKTMESSEFQIDWMDVIKTLISTTVSTSIIYFVMKKKKKNIK